MASNLFDLPRQSLALDGWTTVLRTMGSGPPVLFLHGYPETHVCWHAVAPTVAETHTVVLPDLPGYGDSETPLGDDARFSKRAMAESLVELMATLGHDRFAVVGHDRGARVAYRMALDHPTVVTSLAVIDILPTTEEWGRMDGRGSIGAFHWPFLAQPAGFPEAVIAAAPDTWFDQLMTSWTLDPAGIAPEAMAEYRRCFHRRAVIDGTCADYRAGATIDVEHDRADRAADRSIDGPVLALVSRGRGDLTTIWQRWAPEAVCEVVDGGHFLPEENPAGVLAHLLPFLARS